MSDIKCPICNTPLVHENMSDYWCVHCNTQEQKGLYGSDKLWQELIRTRKELEQSETCCTEWEKQALDYKAENIALSGDLERTRKALDVAIKGLKHMRGTCLSYAADYMDAADNILEQITALEQKDVK